MTELAAPESSTTDTPIANDGWLEVDAIVLGQVAQIVVNQPIANMLLTAFGRGARLPIAFGDPLTIRITGLQVRFGPDPSSDSESPK